MWNSLFNLSFMTFSFGLLIFGNVINVCHGSHSSLHVVNGYKGVVIALSPEINVENHEDFITKTKELIQKSSSALFEATEQKLFFEEVTIIVPNNWTDIVPTPDIPSQRYTDADIIITERESSVHSFSMQFAGCGQHALPIVMTKQLILGVSQQMGDRLFVHEWAHYRFGVFNEFGFPSDPIYPAYYSIAGYPDNDRENKAEVLINSCTDNHKKFNYTSYNVDNGQSYDCMSTNNNTGMPIDDRCIPLPDIENNSFESSLMYSHSVSAVTKFCGSQSSKGVHKHNVDSPNKQNTLCDGKDVWTVINSHKDLQRKSSNIKETKFKIWRESSESGPRTLFAIQNSNIMEERGRKSMINTAIHKFFGDLPESQVALFTYSDGTAKNKQNWIKGRDIRLTFQYSEEPKKIDFQKVLSEGLSFFPKEQGGGIFVIFIGGEDILSSNSMPLITPACEQLKERNVKLKIILFPTFNQIDSRKHSSQLFEAAISITGGQVFPIKEEILSSADKNSLSTANQMVKALGTVMTDYSGDSSETYHLISEQVFNNLEKGTTVSFEFTTDISLMYKELRVYFLQRPDPVDLNPTLVLNTMKLHDPQGKDRVSINSKTQLDNIGYVQGFVTKIDSSDLTNGKWKLSASVNPKAGDSLVAIAEFKTKSFDENVLTAECWLNTYVEYKYSDGPVIAYVNLNKRFDGLVSNASVKLLVRHSENRSYNDVEIIDMLDDGKGDPDITKGDGIYSQYIVNIRIQGYYTVSALITNGNDNNVLVTTDFGSTSLPTTGSTKSCCGSKMVGTPYTLNGNFNRSVECGSFYSSTENNNIEDYPPNTVRDLQVESVDYENRTVSLRWTSTGGDYTSSNVHEYEIRAFHGSENNPDLRQKIRNSFHTFGSVFAITDNLKQKYGEEEKTVITITPEAGGVYYIALRAVDHRGKKSGVSNIVMAYIKMNGNGGGGGHGSWAGLHWWEWLSIGIGIAVVLLLVIIISICFIGKKRRKGDDTDQRTENMPQRRAPDPPRVSPELEKSQSILLDNGSFTQSVEKIPNINVNGIHQTNSAYDSGSQQNLRELSANTLSPVRSWDAKDLLSHWGRVQEAKSRHEPPPVLRIEDLESQSSNRSQSYASSEDDNTAIYTNPNNWRYQDVTARPTYIANGFNEPIYRSSLDPLRSNTPSDNVPRYSTINRIPTQNVSQV